MSLFFPFLTALFITMVLIPLLVKASVPLKLIDLPDERKIHLDGIPRVGGIAMVLGLFVTVLVWSQIDKFVISYLFGVGILLIFGAADDRFDLDYRIKLFGQFLAVLMPVTYGGVSLTHLPFFSLEFVLPDILAIPLTVFVLLGITNAINLSDGLDGLAGGITLLALGLIAVLAYIAEGTTLLLLCLCTIGCVLGFLRFNTYPARIFMGDSGSQFLGFSAGIFVLQVSQPVNTALSPALPLLILGLPVLDMLSVIMLRIREGVSPFKADKKHLHHRLLSLGIAHREVVIIVYITQYVFISSAYFLRYSSDFIICSWFFMLSVLILSLMNIAEHRPLQSCRRKFSFEFGFFSKCLSWARGRCVWSILSFYLVALILPLYLSLVAIFSRAMLPDIGILAVSLLFLCVLSAALLQHFKLIFPWLERVCVYIAVSIFVYLLEGTDDLNSELDILLNGMIVLIAVAVLVNIRFAREGMFEVTTLDYLVVFIVLTLPYLPISFYWSEKLGALVTKLVVLFYGIELLAGHVGWKARFARWVFYYMLILMGAKGLTII